MLASFGWLIFTLVGGWLSDKIGRVKTFLLGYAVVFVWMIPMFALIDTKNIRLYGVALFVMTIGLGISYGPMWAMYAEMFPANVRYSGISIGYALGAILGGAFAATIAQSSCKPQVDRFHRHLHHDPLCHLVHWRPARQGDKGPSAGREPPLIPSASRVWRLAGLPCWPAKVRQDSGRPACASLGAGRRPVDWLRLRFPPTKPWKPPR